MSAHNSGAARHREWKLGCKVYIGNLADGASKSDIEDAFNKYGPLRNVWVARNPPGFAFVEFEDGRDAEDACRHLDGTRIAGGRIKAEMSHGRTRRGRGGGAGGAGPPGFRGHPPPYPPMNGGPHYGAGPMRGAYHGGPPRGPPFYSNGGDYHDGYGGYRVAPHHGPPVPHPGMPPMHHHGYGMDRPPRGAHDRHVPRPRSPIGIRDYRSHYSRSRSNSLGKSPPPSSAPNATQQQQQQQTQQQPQRTARPRTPPSRSPSPDRH